MPAKCSWNLSNRIDGIPREVWKVVAQVRYPVHPFRRGRSSSRRPRWRDWLEGELDERGSFLAGLVVGRVP